MYGSQQERAAKAEARVGTTLRGKYRIEKVLGIGGMASVYEATHRNGRRVAVKVLHGAASLNTTLRTRFLREGHAANAVNHPGAVVVIDDDVTDDGAAFLVMELLEGQAIERIWRHIGALPPEIVLSIGYELCSVLDAAHRAGIIHRDIKPENLFLTRAGQLKVLDFGLAQLRDQPKLTAIGMVFGTPAFMAPEQANGRSSTVDARTDIWSVGATLFTLLSGQTVHLGNTVQDILVSAASKPARSLAAASPGADPRLVHLVDRALAVEKDDRWPSAVAMRKAIGSTCVAMFGEGSLKLPSSDTLLLLPPAAKRGAPLHRTNPGQKFSLVDLSSTSGDFSSGADDPNDGPTQSDRMLPAADDTQDDYPTSSDAVPAPVPGWSALNDEIESGRALGRGAATIPDRARSDPGDIFSHAATVRHAMLASTPAMQWGPPTPRGALSPRSGSWTPPLPPPSTPRGPRLTPRAGASMGQRRHETLLVVLAFAAIALSAILLVAFGMRWLRPSAPGPATHGSAPASR